MNNYLAGSMTTPSMPPVLPRPQDPAPVVSCWAQRDNAFYGVGKAHETLPPGIYRCEYIDGIGPVLTAQIVRTDDLLRLPGSPSDEIVDEIYRFWQRRDLYRNLGYLHKRGVLLWGEAGSGKTSTVMQICQLVTEGERGIAVYATHPELTARCLQLVRRVEPTRPLVVIFEDLDALVEQHGEHEYLALLDGEAQIDNIVSIATTNYPERLDRRFVDRPGRFASIRYIGMPSAEARETYLRSKLPDLDEGVLAEYVTESEGLSIDHLREIVVLTQCDEMALQEAVGRMRGMERSPSSGRSPEWKPPGFGRHHDLGEPSRPPKSRLGNIVATVHRTEQ